MFSGRSVTIRSVNQKLNQIYRSNWPSIRILAFSERSCVIRLRIVARI